MPVLRWLHGNVFKASDVVHDNIAASRLRSPADKVNEIEHIFRPVEHGGFHVLARPANLDRAATETINEAIIAGGARWAVPHLVKDHWFSGKIQFARDPAYDQIGVLPDAPGTVRPEVVDIRRHSSAGLRIDCDLASWIFRHGGDEGLGCASRLFFDTARLWRELPNKIEYISKLRHERPGNVSVPGEPISGFEHRNQLSDDAASSEAAYAQPSVGALRKFVTSIAAKFLPYRRKCCRDVQKVEWFAIIVLDDDFRYRVADIVSHAQELNK